MLGMHSTTSAFTSKPDRPREVGIVAFSSRRCRGGADSRGFKSGIARAGAFADNRYFDDKDLLPDVRHLR